MSIEEIANGLVQHCRELRFRDAINAYYSPDIVSVEVNGENRETRGIEASLGKEDWFDKTFEILGCEVEGPWINDPCFLVKFAIKTHKREDGEEGEMVEYALYSVHEGKIVHERFF